MREANRNSNPGSQGQDAPCRGRKGGVQDYESRIRLLTRIKGHATIIWQNIRGGEEHSPIWMQSLKITRFEGGAYFHDVFCQSHWWLKYFRRSTPLRDLVSPLQNSSTPTIAIQVSLNCTFDSSSNSGLQQHSKWCKCISRSTIPFLKCLAGCFYSLECRNS